LLKLHVRKSSNPNLVDGGVSAMKKCPRVLLVVLFASFAMLVAPADESGAGAFSAEEGEISAPGRLAHTYSIVAVDTLAGEMGVAVQSHWFSVGPVVPWAEAGVGVVATQSLVDVSYGPLGLELMKAGKTAEQALRALLAADPHPELRQVAMMGVRGDVAVHTGESCIAEAGHIRGTNYSVQANLMLKDDVWPAMASAFEEADGDLAERVLAALEAAQSSGGDIRGRQSAAILIVREKPTGRIWKDRVMDLRVEDHPRPVEELRRLVNLHRAYQHENMGDELLAEGDLEGALSEYTAAAVLAPDNLELMFWQAVSLINVGRESEALPLFRKVFKADDNWAVLVERLPDSGLLRVDEDTLERILEQAD
jgi:uncharacterized Ntn-hydrolase superfamily protein